MSDHSARHDQYSERLSAFADGTLPSSDREAVERHLVTCPACRAELAGVRALQGSKPPDLTETERRELHRGIAAARGPGNLVTFPGVRTRSSWRSRLAPALGAAALLVVIAVGILWAGGLTGSDQAAQVGGVGGKAEAGADQAAESQAGLESSVAEPVWERKELRIRSGTLRRLGRTGRPFVSFARAYTVDDAATKRDEFLQLLATSAPTGLAGSVRECARVVFEGEDIIGPSLPALGARGRLEGRKVLVLGFAGSQSDQGPLNQFLLFAWAGGRCADENIAAYVSGPVAER
jgi:Putative zinc-finger